MSSDTMKSNPFNVLLTGAKNVILSFKNIGKDPKRLIPAIVLAVVWLVCMLLPACGVNPKVIKALGFLSFAEAGMSNKAVKIIGGIIGKGMFATALYTLIDLIKNGRNYEKIPFADKLKRGFATDLSSLWVYLFGAGLAAFIFLFMAGNVTVWSFMGGVAATFLTVKNILRGGFLSKLVKSCFETIAPKASAEAYQGLLKGMAAGFALTTFLGFIGKNIVVIIVGGMLTVGGLTMIILTSSGAVKIGRKEEKNS